MKSLIRKRLMSMAATTAVGTSCSPTIVFVDRQTILETEASGTWDDLDAEFHIKEASMEPVGFTKPANATQNSKAFAMPHPDGKK